MKHLPLVSVFWVAASDLRKAAKEARASRVGVTEVIEINDSLQLPYGDDQVETLVMLESVMEEASQKAAADDKLKSFEQAGIRAAASPQVPYL